jgi:CRP-like cAMP-binding protein
MSQQLDAVRAFRNIPIFRGLTDDEMFDIVRICRIFQHPKGTILFRQGDPGNSAYIIASGRIDVKVESSSRTETIAQLGANEVLGELVLLEQGLRSASAVVSQDAVLYELRVSDFAVLREQMHAGAYKVIRAMSRIVCQRLRTVNERIEVHLRGDKTLPPSTSGAFKKVPNAPQRAPEVKEEPNPVSASLKESGAFARGLFAKIWKGRGGE